ncbi:MAG: hypothetical protein M3437_14780 [Chloroflexota bacterium]|nr:hypothetical protein [Chloroflexota bacterium]MDQ5864265.1 hypothetical protein [Chloroflexota bacterium]
MSDPSLVKLPYAAMAYVANNDTKELLVSTSEDGENWSAGHSTGQFISGTPVLAAFENQLFLLFHPKHNPKILMYCMARNTINWSPGHAMNWSPAHLVPSRASEDGSLAGVQSPALVAFKGPEPGDQLHLSYAAEYDLIQCRTVRVASRDRQEFDFLHPYTITIEDKTKKDGISHRFSHGRRAVAVLDDKLIMAFVRNNDDDTLSYATSADVHSMSTWQSPHNIAREVSDPAIVVLNNRKLVNNRWERYRTPVVAWRYNNGGNELGVATMGDDGKVRDFGNMSDLSRYGPALTTLDFVLILAFVAADQSNDLLVCTSLDGVKWSPHRRTGLSSSTTPALATSYFIHSNPNRR